MNARAAYHHGDLRNALIAAAARLAERGGPDAVTIRAAAREVGVTPTAAYRHFAGQEELLEATKDACNEQMSVAMRKRLASVPEREDPVEAVIARLEAIGYGYVDFALAEPGLFRTVFHGGTEGKDIHDPALHEDPDNPHTMLIALVGRLVELGFVDERHRLGTEIGAWSLVHGLASLLIDGPLAGIPAEERTVVIDQTLTTYTASFRNAHRR